MVPVVCRLTGSGRMLSLSVLCLSILYAPCRPTYRRPLKDVSVGGGAEVDEGGFYFWSGKIYFQNYGPVTTVV